MTGCAAKRLSCTAALVAALGTGGSLRVLGQNPEGRPLTAAPASTVSARLVVGKAVHVSKANESVRHNECTAAADPTDPKRLIVAAIYEKGVRTKSTATGGVVGYHSANGGQTWQPAFEYPGEATVNRGDPALAFGPDGAAHFVCMRTNLRTGREHRSKLGDLADGGLEFARSPDGGKTWGPLTEAPGWVDRPWLALDRTTGPFRGRLYCLYEADRWTCLTSARAEPKTDARTAPIPRKEGLRFNQVSNLVVLSDGAVVFAEDRRGDDTNRRPETPVWRSDDGGGRSMRLGR